MIREMLEELTEYHRSKGDILREAVQARLEASFETYEKELNSSLLSLKTKHEKSIIKRIAKL